MEYTKNVTGHIRYRKGLHGDSWQIIINMIDSETGQRKRIYETHHCTEDQANKKLNELIELYSIKQRSRDDITLAECFNKYLAARKDELQATTFSSYDSHINNRIIPYIGDIKMKNLDIPCIRDWLIELRSADYGTQSIRGAYSLLKQVCGYAVDEGIIEQNPCKKEYNTVSDSAASDCYTKEEIQKAINAAKGTDMYLMLMLQLTLGLRRGELNALQWRDIDFDKKLVNISHTRVMAAKEVIEKSPKSESGSRSIPLGDNLYGLLKTAYDDDAKIFKDEFSKEFYVIHKPDGTPYRPDSLTQKWDRFLEKNKLRKIRLHDLRHTAISHMIANGCDPKTVQFHAGHANAATTLNTYSKVIRENVIAKEREHDKYIFELDECSG